MASLNVSMEGFLPHVPFDTVFFKGNIVWRAGPHTSFCLGFLLKFQADAAHSSSSPEYRNEGIGEAHVPRSCVTFHPEGQT